MRRCQSRSLVTLLATVLLGCACPRVCPPIPCGPAGPAEPGTPPKPPPDLPTGTPSPWTFALYIAADNMDGCRMVHLLEAFAQAPDSANLQVVAFVDQMPYGCADGETELPDGALVLDLPRSPGAQVVRVRQGRLEPLPWPGPAEPNTAAPETLRTFLEVVRRAAPSEKLALWTVSHGQACTGICQDETSMRAGGVEAGDALALGFEEMRHAIQTVDGESAATVDLTVFVGCSVACMEMAHELCRCSSWIAASESPTQPWSISYQLLQEEVIRDPTLSAERLGRRIVETHESPSGTTCDRGREGAGISLIDGSAYGETQDLLGVFLDQVRRGLQGPDGKRVAEDLLESGQLAAAFGCGVAGPCIIGDAPGGCCMRDLGMLVRTLGDRQNDPQLAAAARHLAVALGRLAPCVTSSADEADTTGLSIYLPCDQVHLEHYEPLGFPTDTGWAELLGSALAQSPCATTGPSASLPTLRSGGPENPLAFKVAAQIKGDPTEVRGAWLVARPADALSPCGLLVLAPLAVDLGTATLSGTWSGQALAIEPEASGERPLYLLAAGVASGTTTATARVQTPFFWQPSDTCQGCPEVVDALYSTTTSSTTAEPRGHLVRLSSRRANGPAARPITGGDILVLQGGDAEAARLLGGATLHTIRDGRVGVRWLGLGSTRLRWGIHVEGRYGTATTTLAPDSVLPPQWIPR